MIQVKNVTKYYDDYKVLDDISLHIPKGAIYGLVGPNGAGKTTIINHINGALKPRSGDITIDGEPIYENIDIKKRVISIADDWFYYSTYNVKQMARFYADIYPTFSYERYNAIKEVFDIDEKRQIRKLSKGMKKQVAFWMSLSAMPDVLILDEPLDGLDPVMRKQVLNLVIADVADREMTVLVSSHNLKHSYPTSKESAIVYLTEKLINSIYYMKNVRKAPDFSKEVLIRNIFAKLIIDGTLSASGLSLGEYETLKKYYIDNL